MVITIREQTKNADTFKTTISFDGRGEYVASITDPFSKEEERLLEWYFEEHLRFPFLDEMEAEAAAWSITKYGEDLFRQLFQDHQAYSCYANGLRHGIGTLCVEICGSPEFHALHWEALKDPDFPTPLVVDALVVRKNLVPQVFSTKAVPSATLNLLLVSARPSGKEDVGYRTISRPLMEALRQSDLRVQVHMIRPATYQALVNHLEETRDRHGRGYYHLIHLDVHGALLTYQMLRDSVDHCLVEGRYGRPNFKGYAGVKAYMFMEGDRGCHADPVEAGELADLLITHQIPVAVLNACQSGKQVGVAETSLGSRLMQAGVQMVLAMGYSVTVSAAELIMRILYEQLFAGSDLPNAVRHARLGLYNHKDRRVYFNQIIQLEDWMLPVVYQNENVRFSLRDFTQQEQEAYNQQQAQRFEFPCPTYAFVGRDLEILEIERRLLLQGNLLLLRGMGGAGKTTLLRHLSAWWQATHFVDQVFYFGYDDRAWTRQQIMFAIAQRLLSPAEAASFNSMSPDAQQCLLAERLRARRHVLMLDNLESITGNPLVISNTLPPAEQTMLQSFLAALTGGRTLVLLGSRGDEEWLAGGTFGDNVYELIGLDPEAASVLVYDVLERHNATQYRQDPNLQKLLKLLAGFPLALQVVLSNLAHQTPAEVLDALVAGDLDLDTGNTQDKTSSILRCIDYSHSNISPEAQGLLICLAPFASVVNVRFLPEYAKQLTQRGALAHLPFDRWQDVLKESANWGLISAEPQVPGVIRLQPVLPYFLQRRLQAPDQSEIRQAVERAFCQHYAWLGSVLFELLRSKTPQEKQIGQVLVALEYENLSAALRLSLKSQLSIIGIYRPLAKYLDTAQAHRLGMELAQMVRDYLEAYPNDELAGRTGVELAAVLDQIGKCQLDLRQYDEAQASYQRALSVLATLGRADEKQKAITRAGIYHQLGLVAEAQRHWDQAEIYYRQSLEISTDLGDHQTQANTYHQLGTVALEQQQWEKARSYYLHALDVFIKSNDRGEQAPTYYQLGRVAEEQRQWERAEQYYQVALQIAVEVDDRYQQASTYHQLGMVAEGRRQPERAEWYYQQALTMYIEFDDYHSQARVYHQLGMIALEQGRLAQAEQYYRRALDNKITSTDNYGAAGTYHQLGRVAEEQHNWEQARRYYQEALRIYGEFNDRYFQAYVLHQLGRVAAAQEEWDQAEAYYQEGLQSFMEFGDTYRQGLSYHQLGLVAEHHQRHEQAKGYYHQALRIMEQINDRYEQAAPLHGLGRMAQAEHRFQEARAYFLKAFEIFSEYKDYRKAWMVLGSIARLWQVTADTSLPTAIASIHGVTADKAEQLLRQVLSRT